MDDPDPNRDKMSPPSTSGPDMDLTPKAIARLPTSPSNQDTTDNELTPRQTYQPRSAPPPPQLYLPSLIAFTSIPLLMIPSSVPPRPPPPPIKPREDLSFYLTHAHRDVAEERRLMSARQLCRPVTDIGDLLGNMGPPPWLGEVDWDEEFGWVSRRPAPVSEVMYESPGPAMSGTERVMNGFGDVRRGEDVWTGDGNGRSRDVAGTRFTGQEFWHRERKTSRDIGGRHWNESGEMRREERGMAGDGNKIGSFGERAGFDGQEDRHKSKRSRPIKNKYGAGAKKMMDRARHERNLGSAPRGPRLGAFREQVAEVDNVLDAVGDSTASPEKVLRKSTSEGPPVEARTIAPRVAPAVPRSFEKTLRDGRDEIGREATSDEEWVRENLGKRGG